MALSNSVIRRYTPPTCTLEVLAQSSPLSRWMGKSVLKQVRFNLHFDDPRQPKEEKVVVQGDRDQLEALYTAVSSYVQEILQQSPENFWASRVEKHSGSETSSTAVEDIPNINQDFSVPKNEFGNRQRIYIQASSHLTHQLFLGSLANQVSGSAIKLSLLQLFDLATALDEYMADVVALPADTQKRRRNSFALPAWAPVAAVLVLGFGLMPLTYQYANRLRKQQKPRETVAKAKQDIGANVSPTPLLNPLSTPNPLLSPSPNLSLPSLGSGSNFPNASITTPGASSKPTLSVSPQPGSTFPSISTNPSTSLSRIPLPPPIGNANPGSTTAKKPQAGGQTISISPSTSPKSPSAINNGGQVAIKPNIGLNNSPSIPKSNTSLPTSLPSLNNPSSAKLPVFPSKQAAQSPQNNNSGNSLTNPSKTSSDLLEQLRQSRRATPANNGKNSTATTAANRETLFDTNQVAEVRDYLRQRWQPPRGLNSPLEYSLTVGVDGALEQILPLGKAARDYVDWARIPKIGRPFVSSSRNGQNVRLRVVLRPNGKVEVFPEND